MFYELSGEIFNQVLETEEGAWIVSYDEPGAPRFIVKEELKAMTKVEAPEGYLKRMDNHESTKGRRDRLELIKPLLDNPNYISDRAFRKKKMLQIAEESGSSVKRIQRLFYRYLAGRPLVEEKLPVIKEETQDQKNFAWAIEKYYYSAKKMSLRTVYDLLLLSKYTDVDGKLMEKYPTWYMFQHYFYEKHYHQKARAEIARNGLSDYQRNRRPLFGSAMEWKDRIGVYQMDETQADIYLVSRLNRKEVIGRPNIYLAVDTATQLIAGIYVGLDAGEQAVISCLVNAAMDKVEFCKSYGIEITKEQWPNAGLPGEIITDKGKEFIGSRMQELSMRFGMELQSLPPFRPDGKGIVEKSFDLLQQKYKPLLRGKGVIEEDSAERWVVDYRSQAVLTLEDFTKIVIHCVLYLNSCRVLENFNKKEVVAAPIPAELWRWHEEEGRSGIILVSQEQLYHMSLPRKTASLTRKGIGSQGLWYVCKDYKKLLEQKKAGERVTIAYDPENVNNIYLLDGLDYIPFELVSYCKQYAGASEEEYKLEREHKKVQKQELERMDLEGRLNVIQNIKAIVNESECEEKGKLNHAVIEKNREREMAG